MTRGRPVAKGFPLVKSGRTQRIEPGDEGFPRRLAGLRAVRDGVHVVGTIRDLAPAVAIVGSRAASFGAMALARTLARHVGAIGGLVVSGGAIGVDTAAHVGALEARGPTTVVLGTGADIIYPERNARLFAAVVEAGGGLLSMFPLGAQPRPQNFVRRNELIAALADVVVVAATVSSGSLHTARHALRMQRPVAAVPGTPGSDALVAAGAAVIESTDDLDRALAGDPRRLARTPLTGDLARAWDALDAIAPRDAEDLAAALAISIPSALSLLADLEATGWTLAVPGSAYVRAP